MTNSEPTPFQTNFLRLQAGDAAARAELLRLTRDRLLAMTRKMMVRYARLRRFVESDDVLQEVMIRLDRCLADVPMKSPTDYLRIAATNIRRELLDQIRHHFGPNGVATHHATPNGLLFDDPLSKVPAADQDDPALLSDAAELHDHVENLSSELHDIVHFHYYLGMTQPEIAALLGLSPKTVQRRLLEAKLLLKQRLDRPDPD